MSSTLEADPGPEIVVVATDRRRNLSRVPTSIQGAR